jgi:hypothetical protein
MRKLLVGVFAVGFVLVDALVTVVLPQRSPIMRQYFIFHLLEFFIVLLLATFATIVCYLLVRRVRNRPRRSESHPAGRPISPGNNPGGG